MPTAKIKMVRIAQLTRWALLLAAVGCLGCQTAIPASFPGAKAARDEQKILKLAKRDPFPSPKDVGLDGPTSVP